METELHEINVTLSKYQKEKICKAFLNREKIRLRLTKDALRGSDTLIVPSVSLEGMDDIPDGIDAIIDESTFNEMWEEFSFLYENPLDYNMWEYYGLFFTPAVDESLESKGMEIVLNYSLITDSTKDSVTRNIEKLIEYDVDCYCLV